MCLNHSYAALGREITVPRDAPCWSESRVNLRRRGSSRSRVKPERVEARPAMDAACRTCSVLPRDADLDFRTPGAAEVQAALLLQANHGWDAQPTEGD